MSALNCISPKGLDSPAQGRAKRRPGLADAMTIKPCKGTIAVPIAPLQGLVPRGASHLGRCPRLSYLGLSGLHNKATQEPLAERESLKILRHRESMSLLKRNGLSFLLLCDLCVSAAVFQKAQE
jgi:hypothetical protein